MDKEFNLISVIRIILKWKKQIVGITIVSGIIAAFFSVFVMDEYYLSWSTFYPTNQYLSDRSMIFNTENTGGQIDYFGGKADVNRILTIANSAPVIDYIIDSFKLVEHYKIDRGSRYWKTKVTKKFEKNFKAIKTERDAVSVSVYDTDPKLASAIVNAIVEKTDELNKLHIAQSKRNVYELISGQIQEQQEKVAAYVDTLSKLSEKYNIKVSTGADGTVVVNGNNFRAVQEYKAILEKQENALRELNNRINIKDQMEVAMKSNSSSLFIVESAFPADRREKPVRSLVVIITMLITGFVSVLGVLLIEQFKEIKAQL
jgi:capsular polysaccharide biosynthesis protein